MIQPTRRRFLSMLALLAGVAGCSHPPLPDPVGELVQAHRDTIETHLARMAKVTRWFDLVAAEANPTPREDIRPDFFYEGSTPERGHHRNENFDAAVVVVDDFRLLDRIKAGRPVGTTVTREGRCFCHPYPFIFELATALDRPEEVPDRHTAWTVEGMRRYIAIAEKVRYLLVVRPREETPPVVRSIDPVPVYEPGRVSAELLLFDLKDDRFVTAFSVEATNNPNISVFARSHFETIEAAQQAMVDDLHLEARYALWEAVRVYLPDARLP